MKAMSIFYLILGAIVLTDFVSSFFYQEEVYKVLFWETNIWVYRTYKLVLLLAAIMFFIEKRRSQKLNSK